MRQIHFNSVPKEHQKTQEVTCEVSDSFFALNIVFNSFVYPYEMKKCCKKYKKGKRCKKCPDN